MPRSVESPARCGIRPMQKECSGCIKERWRRKGIAQTGHNPSRERIAGRAHRRAQSMRTAAPTSFGIARRHSQFARYLKATSRCWRPLILSCSWYLADCGEQITDHTADSKRKLHVPVDELKGTVGSSKCIPLSDRARCSFSRPTTHRLK